MFEAIDAWARSIPPSVALLAASIAGQACPGAASAAACSGSGVAAGVAGAVARSISSSSSRAGSASAVPAATRSRAGSVTPTAAAPTAARSSSARNRVSATAADAAPPSAVAALAARLAAGCSKDEPWAQLQLARACYSWVVSHVQLPRGCDVESGADVHTWDVGLLFFGEEEEQQLLHQVSRRTRMQSAHDISGPLHCVVHSFLVSVPLMLLV